MLGRRSLNLELILLDPDLERTLRRERRAPVEMRDNIDQPENVKQPRGEYEQPRGDNVDYIISLRDLFAPIVKLGAEYFNWFY
jgi:hypothetical protein